MRSRRSLRLLFVGLMAISVLAVGLGLATAPGANSAGGSPGGGPDVPASAPPSDDITVIATDSNQWRAEQGDGPRATAELIAFEPDGDQLYVDESHDLYWDVDPVPGTPATVEYAYADHLEGDACPSTWEHERYGVDAERWRDYERVHDPDACTRNGVERVNLRTGEVTHVWSIMTPGKSETRYHDVDRLDDERLVVADIYFDRVFVVNAQSGQIEWSWNASDRFPTDTGGPYPSDWTHLNDVEVLPDGRIMVSLRNLDQVVFLDRNGIVEGWTLGAEDDRKTLYEQHNPDYIPPDRGGPAVLVADSENNRLVEYQRTGDAWTRTWTWSDARLQWPRDADRLPNGHTLVTDSNGDRVFEVDRSGEIVWSVTVAFPYEAERLGTGDESTGGPSAASAGLASRSGDDVATQLKALLPGKYLNSVMYATPVWMGLVEVAALFAGILVGLVWLLFEVRWSLATRGADGPVAGRRHRE